MNELERLRRENVALLEENARLRNAASISRERMMPWFADLVEHAPAFVCLLEGKNHVVAFANAVFRESLGNRDIVGRSMLEGIPEVRGQGFTELLDGVLRTGVAHVGHETPVRLDRGNGVEQRVVTFVYQVVTDAVGARTGILVIGIDETDAAHNRAERIRLEEKLRQSQKMDSVGRLAGGIAHDFNNLLSVILNCVEMRLEPDAPPNEAESDLRDIQVAARRACELTTQLLAFSRQQVLQPTLLDIGDVVSSLRAMLQRLLGESISLVIDAHDHAGSALVDRGQLEQVVVNLVVNARDAMSGSGTITVEVAHSVVTDEQLDPELAPGDYVVICVHDTGTGMDDATRARIFEPFFTTKPRDKGTGLGLATVFGIVKQSGGHAIVTSELGRGSTFRVFLPRSAAAATGRETRPPPSKLRRGTETILFVEDEDQLRTVTCTVLRRHGYTVHDAANAGEAFLIADQHPGEIDLLLTDVIMPRITGLKLAEALAARHPALKTLFISGYTDDEVLRAGVREARTHFLQKPFTPRTLLAKVRAVLDDGHEDEHEL